MRVCVDVDITSKAQTPMIESEREGERDKETAQNSRGRGERERDIVARMGRMYKDVKK